MKTPILPFTVNDLSLTPDEYALAYRVIAESDKLNNNFRLPGHGPFRRQVKVFGFRFQNHTLIFVGKHLSRPTVWMPIFLSPQSGSFLLPTLSLDHFVYAAEQLGLSEQDYYWFYPFLRLDYGVAIKKSAPIRVYSEAVLQEHGLAQTSIINKISNYEHLWWQRWGGYLYEFSIDNELQNFIYRIIIPSVGDYKHIPITFRR